MPNWCLIPFYRFRHPQAGTLFAWLTPWEWAMLTVYSPHYFFTLRGIGAAKQYWFGFKNFGVIMRYNGSTHYVMAVATLATRIQQAVSPAISTRLPVVSELLF